MVIWSGNSAEFGFGGEETQNKFFSGFCVRPHWARPPGWAYDLAISGRGSAKMSQKCEKVEKFSNNFFKFRSQNLVIWSGNSAEFQGSEAKKRKKRFFFRILCEAPLGQAPWLGVRLSNFGPGERQNEPKMRKRLKIPGVTFWSFGVGIQPNYRVWRRKKRKKIYI